MHANLGFITTSATVSQCHTQERQALPHHKSASHTLPHRLCLPSTCVVLPLPNSSFALCLSFLHLSFVMKLVLGLWKLSEHTEWSIGTWPKAKKHQFKHLKNGKVPWLYICELFFIIIMFQRCLEEPKMNLWPQILKLYSLNDREGKVLSCKGN